MSMAREVGKYHQTVKLRNGVLHLFSNPEVLASLDRKVYKMADNNLRIPRNHFMSYTPDAHVSSGACVGTTAVWKMSDGFVSPSIVGSDIGCGIRVHLTPLHKRDLQDKKVRRKLIKRIEKYVPTKRIASPFRNIELERVVKEGIYGLPAEYLPERGVVGSARSVTHLEHARFAYDVTALESLPERLWKQTGRELGTLGGGNHFIEIQHVRVDEGQRETAEKWGLFDGQVVVMIHSGSRAWGRMLRPEYTNRIKDAMEMWGIGTRDPKLIYVPIRAEEGRWYLNLMYSALNYAVANRHMIAFGVRAAFQEVFGTDLEMPVLYDLMHNYALEETHRGQPMLVHRKGTTRALPAGHELNPEPYRETGHPALIPGSMGTASYIMVGAKSGEKNFYSICHGAGRIHARDAVREHVSVDAFAHSMKVGTDEEVVVNRWTLEHILTECPQAYKDVDQIIDSVVGAGLASVVAACRPMAVVKGT
jgi:tRNA-splicing ligase RtcB (3'-phosphate/5'-hydroxy nucleic acid ligase)